MDEIDLFFPKLAFLYQVQWQGLFLWKQSPAILNLLDFSKFSRIELYMFLVPESCGPTHTLIASSLCGNRCNEVTKDNVCVVWGHWSTVGSNLVKKISFLFTHLGRVSKRYGSESA